MRVRLTRWRPPAAGAAAAALAGVVALAFVPAAMAGENTDAQGDTVNDDTDQPMDVPEADILRSWTASDQKGIAFGAQVRRWTDPASHKAWVDGDSSVEWDLDVNGDSEADYTVVLSNDDGKVTGVVERSDAGDGDKPVCSVAWLGHAADKGYGVTVDRACIGSPSSVAYLVEFFYDTNPGDDNAPEATDASPDRGMSPAA